MPRLSEFAGTVAEAAGSAGAGSAMATWLKGTALVASPIVSQIFASFTTGELCEEQHIKSELYER
jgi:hypothetical protein